MNWKVVSRNIGYALLVSALFMLLSVGVSLLNGHDSALSALLISFLAVLWQTLRAARTNPATELKKE